MAQYDIVYVARAPQQLTSPSLVVTGPVFGKLTWAKNLYTPSTIEVTASTNELDSDLKARLRDLVTFPTEIWVYRDGVLTVAGTVVGGKIDGSQVTLAASGLETYLMYMLITADKSFAAIDQALIVKEFVDDWQALDYGNFGIDTSAIVSHAVTRTKEYVGSEFQNVYEASIDLGSGEAGFDLWVEPLTRELRLDNPTRGSDLSATVFLERGIASPNIKFSVAPGIVASESFGQAKDESENIITSTQVNTTLRASFGRSGYGETYEDGDQILLDDKTLASLNVRDNMLFQPGPGLIPVDGAKVDDFDPGDLVSYLYDAGLGQQQGIYRVKKKQVTADGGQEAIEVEFE